MIDPRNYQICVLCVFVVAGRVWLGFDFNPVVAVAIAASALFVQGLLFGGQYKSALISSLSLVLLLRTDSIAIAVLAGVIAIAGKRYLRLQGRHIFNPSALALVLVSVLFSNAWLAPGQWGPMGLSVLLLAGAGLLVVTRAHRLDVALAFLISFAVIVVARGWWLGDPLAIALHQLQNGALIVFAFFMITDPKTTAATPTLRVLQGVSVAVLSAYLQFAHYLSSAPLFALIILAPVFVLPWFQKDSSHENTISNAHLAGWFSTARAGHGVLRFLRRQS